MAKVQSRGPRYGSSTAPQQGKKNMKFTEAQKDEYIQKLRADRQDHNLRMQVLQDEIDKMRAENRKTKQENAALKSTNRDLYLRTRRSSPLRTTSQRTPASTRTVRFQARPQRGSLSRSASPIRRRLGGAASERAAIHSAENSEEEGEHEQEDAEEEIGRAHV